MAFRDYLRAYPSVAQQYLQLKAQLAAANHGMTHESREMYSLSKTEFIEGVLANARVAGFYAR